LHKRAFVCTVILIIVLAAIPILKKNQVTVEPKGTIINLTIDVIPGADVGSGSRENWLRERAEEFEAENAGVFITVRSLKSDQAQLLYTEDLRDQTGNIAAYTSGTFCDNACFLTLDNGTKSQLYMYAGYVLVINPALCEKQGESYHIPSVAASDTQFDCGSILAAQCFSGTDTVIHTGKRSDMISLFQNEEVSSIIASNYVVYRFCRMADQGKGFAVEMLPLSSTFTDQGHYVSIVEKSEAENEAAKAFAAFLMEEDSQRTCRDIGMFSVYQTEDYEQGTILSSLWENTGQLRIAPPFTWFNAGDLARQLAQDANAGNASSANDLAHLLEKLAIE